MENKIKDLLAQTADAAKVLLGAYAPALAPTADVGKVRN